MKNIYTFIAALVVTGYVGAVSARDDIADYSIEEALGTEQAKSALGTNVQFYFGDQPHPPVVKNFSEYGSNRKTNGVNKTDKEACQWAFISAMKALRDKAKSVDANAVVNIRSNYRNNTTTSSTTFKCGSGSIMSGVAVLGDVVTVK
jgi:uncharacterized protein YbjQ (UPF0145 family)